jgi:hypothetical protein
VIIFGWPYFEQNFITKSFGKAMTFEKQKLPCHTGGASGKGYETISPNEKGYKISQVILKVVTNRIEIRAYTH